MPVRSGETRRVAAELRQAQLRIEELEARVAQVDEKASFTQALLERPRPEPRTRIQP